MRPKTLIEVLRSIRSGKLTPEELCEGCLHRADVLQHLNMFITMTPNLARRQATASSIRLQQGLTSGLLEGVPVAVKDNFCTKGIVTSCASRMLAKYRPPYDATVVSRLQEQGVVVLGKTNMDEFAMGAGSVDSIYGPVKNPWTYRAVRKDEGQKVERSLFEGQGQPEGLPEEGWEEWRIAGGSSGGSAAAVASGVCYAALGSDTGGSTRIPASYCGVVGLKPTYGLLSRHGLVPLVNSMDVPGILTATVEDAALVLNVLAGHDLKDSTTVKNTYSPVSLPATPSVQGLRIGIPKEFHAPGTAPEVLEAWRRAADACEQGGAVVEEVSLPHMPLSILTYAALCCCEVASNMSRYDGIQYGLRTGSEESTEELYAESRHLGFNDVVRSRILTGNYFLLKRNYAHYFLKAQRIRRLIAQDFHRAFGSGLDLLLTPTTPTVAPLQSWYRKKDNQSRCREQDVYTQPANLAGVPAVSVPVALNEEGLPIGLQLIGPCFSEPSLLAAASWLQEHSNFLHLELD